MTIEPGPLPCDPAAFAPQLSVEAVARHRRQQQAGLDALNALLGGELDGDGGGGNGGGSGTDTAGGTGTDDGSGSSGGGGGSGSGGSGSGGGGGGGGSGNGGGTGGEDATAVPAPAPAPMLADLARTARGALAAHAAQAWAEDFYWAGLRAPRPDGENEPRGALAEAIATAFGDARRLRERFNEAALRLDGRGWTWLAQRRDGRLAILATPGSITPLPGSDTPLLACCLWPHAFEHDYGDSRERYLAAFWQLVDWEKVGRRIR